MDFYDAFEVSYDYEKNRLKYFKNALIISKIIKSAGELGTIFNLGLIGNALLANTNWRDLSGAGGLLLLFLIVYYYGNKYEVETISDYAEYLEQNLQSLLLTKFVID